MQRNLRSWPLRSDFDQNFLVTHRIQLNRVNAQSDKNVASPVFKITKHGLVSFVLPNKLYWADLTIHRDIHRSPGPVNLEIITQSRLPSTNTNPRGLIEHSRSELFKRRLRTASVTHELLGMTVDRNLNWVPHALEKFC